MATSDISKSPLYIDSTNGRVGIGTASPATALDLGTTIGAKLTLYPPTYSIGVESNELRIASNAVTSFYSGGHSGTERMRLTADGNVGIGTASPQELLHLSLPSGTNGDIVRLTRSAGAYSFQLGVSSASTSNLYISDNSNNNIIDFTSSGKVGIGTSSPASNLTVTANSSGSSIVVGDFVNSSSSINGTGAKLWISGRGDSSINRGTYIEGIINGSGSRHDLVFATSGYAAAPTERMRIDSSGRVTMPYQPAFNAIDGLSSNGTAYVIPFTTAVTNVGSHYNTSTYRFTAPVAGSYFFMHNGMSNNGYNRTRYKVNGTFVGNEFFSVNVGYANFVGSIILTLAVSDYVEVWNDVQSNSQGDMHSNYRAFSGFLIG